MMNKKFIFYALFIILFFLTGCKVEEDSWPPYTYETYIQFLDDTGKNLLEIRDRDIEMLDNSSDLIEMPGEKNVNSISLTDRTINNDLFVRFTAGSFPRSNRVKKIVLTIVSNKIFGDNEKHTLSTEWEWIDNHSNFCKSISIDNHLLEKKELQSPDVFSTVCFLYTKE